MTSGSNLSVAEDTAQPQPVAQAARIQTIDIIRGVALLGILMMNIPYFALPDHLNHHQAFANPGDANYWTRYWVEVLFSGKMRALFSMLFGAGVLLFTASKEANRQLNVADLYYRRMIWMVVFGLVDAFLLLWQGDILYWYGLCGLFLFPMRHVSARRLGYLTISFRYNTHS